MQVAAGSKQGGEVKPKQMNHYLIWRIPMTLGRSRVMAQAIVAWAILIVLVAGAETSAVPSPIERAESGIVARVNGDPVTRAELQRVLADRSMRRRLQQEFGLQESDSKELIRLAVRMLVSQRLILQEAGRRGITVAEQDLDRIVAALRRRPKYTNRLDERSFRESLRTRILETRARAALVEGVRLSEEQVQAYYEAHREDLKTAEAVWLRIITVEDEEAAEEILATLKKAGEAGGDVREQAMQFIGADQGTDMGWVDPQTLPPPVREAVGSLKAGESSRPVQTDAGLLIVRLEDRRPAQRVSLADARPQIEQRLLTAKRQQALQDWLLEQEKHSRIEVFLQGDPFTAEVVNGSGE